MEYQLIDIIRYYIKDAILAVYGNEEILWQDSRPKPKQEQIDAWKISYPHDIAKDNCKSKAKDLIFNCDWSVLPDVNIYNRSEFESYRAILRDYILNPVENPDFPTEPVPKWIFTTKTMGDNNG
jgi:hypothetical protein